MRELEDDNLINVNEDDDRKFGLNEQNAGKNPEPESLFKDLPRSLEILRDKSLTSSLRNGKTSDISNILKAFDEVEKAKEEIQKAADERVNKLGREEDAPDKREYRRKLKEKEKITVAEGNYLLDLLAKVVTVINSERSRDDKKKLTPEQQQALEMIKMYTGHQLIALYGAQPIYMPTLHQLRLRAENSLEKILNSHKEDEPEEEGILDRLLNSDPSTSEWKETQKEIAVARNEFERRGGYKEKDPEPEEEEPKPEEKPEAEERGEDPGNKKDESLEEDMADAIFSSLMNQRFPGTDELVRGENFYAINMETGKESILSNERDKNLPVGYDSYIRLHTGRAVINGTKNEIIEDLSKALAAHALQREKKSFDVDKIHKYASLIKENFDFDNMPREKLASYLQDPKKIGRVSWNITQTAYGITNNVSYETYLNRMRKLYKQLLEPTKNDSYRKMYDAVEKAAHLPEDLTNIDRNKLNETIAYLNYDIMRLSKKYVLDNCKNFSNRSHLAGLTGDAMDAYCTAASVTEGAEYLPERLVARVNEKGGTVAFNNDDNFNLTAREHIYEDQYGHRMLSSHTIRDLDPEKLDDMKRKIKVPDNDILKNAKEEIRNTGREIAEEKQKNKPEKNPEKNPKKKKGLALDENADGEKKPKRRNSISYKK